MQGSSTDPKQPRAGVKLRETQHRLLSICVDTRLYNLWSKILALILGIWTSTSPTLLPELGFQVDLNSSVCMGTFWMLNTWKFQPTLQECPTGKIALMPKIFSSISMECRRSLGPLTPGLTLPVRRHHCSSLWGSFFFSGYFIIPSYYIFWKCLIHTENKWIFWSITPFLALILGLSGWLTSVYFTIMFQNPKTKLRKQISFTMSSKKLNRNKFNKISIK